MCADRRAATSDADFQHAVRRLGGVSNPNLPATKFVLQPRIGALGSHHASNGCAPLFYAVPREIILRINRVLQEPPPIPDLNLPPQGANHLIYDVTSIMKPLIEGTWGLQSHSIAEGGNTDGETLVIIYQNANTNGTAIIMDAELSQGGDTTTLNFANPYASGDVIMSLASTFSFNGNSATNATGQVTNVDVTTSSTAARRLTSCAGGNDDGNFVAENGALLTVGGVGDSASNPNPNCEGGAGDDELYNLGLGNSANATPFLQAGDTSISFRTNNPSGDDNVYGLFFTSSFQISKVDGGDICGGPNGPVCPPTNVPEPGGLALLGLGMLGLLPFVRRRAK